MVCPNLVWLQLQLQLQLRMRSTLNLPIATPFSWHKADVLHYFPWHSLQNSCLVHQATWWDVATTPMQLHHHCHSQTWVWRCDQVLQPDVGISGNNIVLNNKTVEFVWELTLWRCVVCRLSFPSFSMWLSSLASTSAGVSKTPFCMSLGWPLSHADCSRL